MGDMGPPHGFKSCRWCTEEHGRDARGTRNLPLQLVRTEIDPTTSRGKFHWN
jgi:hypothetical protein